MHLLMRQLIDSHDHVIKWKHFPVTGPLWGEFTGHRWIPLTKASDSKLWCFFNPVPEQMVEQTIADLRRHRGHYDITVMIQY